MKDIFDRPSETFCKDVETSFYEVVTQKQVDQKQFEYMRRLLRDNKHCSLLKEILSLKHADLLEAKAPSFYKCDLGELSMNLSQYPTRNRPDDINDDCIYWLSKSLKIKIPPAKKAKRENDDFRKYQKRSVEEAMADFKAELAKLQAEVAEVKRVTRITYGDFKKRTRFKRIKDLYARARKFVRKVVVPEGPKAEVSAELWRKIDKTIKERNQNGKQAVNPEIITDTEH